MRPRPIFLLPAILVLTACSYVPSTNLVSMNAGESANITITAFEYEFGQSVPMGGVSVVSSDPTIFTVEQDPTLQSTEVTIHALRPGLAQILSVEPSIPLVTVEVSSCLPVSATPQITEVQALVGVPVELHVFVDNPYTFPLWNQEVGGRWQPIPFASGKQYAFTPAKSGTYRFRVHYPGYCDDVDTIITVVASTRGRAARH